MGAYKDKNGTWFASARYKNWTGETKRKMKRGFPTKWEALAWEREFIAKHDGNLEMTFRGAIWRLKISIKCLKQLSRLKNYKIHTERVLLLFVTISCSGVHYI